MSKSKLNDKVIVVDVESTCWDGPPPSGAQSEIIEIGICLVDSSTYEISDKRSVLVKPITSEVSPFCNELTTLTQEMVDTGVSFVEACDILKKDYKSHKRLWTSWGDYDRKMFERMCKLHSVRSPFGIRHINLKAMYGMLHALNKDLGMAEVLKKENIKLLGTHHRGHDDAENIARILSRVIERTQTGSNYDL